MSKQSEADEAKKSQGYISSQPPVRRCKECNFSKLQVIQGKYYPHNHRNVLLCTIGKFMVNANAICDRFEKAE